MLSQVEPMNHLNSELDNPSTGISNSSDPNHPSPLMKRKMNLEKLDLKTFSSRGISLEFSSDNLHESEAIEAEPVTKFTGLDSGNQVTSSSSFKKPQEPALTVKVSNNFLSAEFGQVSKEWLSRNKEDGSQSPFPVKKPAMAPLDFSSMPENEPGTADRGESNQTAFDSPYFENKRNGPSRFSSDYRIVEELGKGSFGKVFKCINNLDKKEYAVKQTIRRFIGRYKVYGINEMKALAQLTALEDNDYVARYYHSWVEADILYIVMEYCPSSLTKQRRDKGKFSEIELKKIARDVCLGLSYLHRNNLVHLDVKTENILISKKNRYKLGDMGQTRELQSEQDLDEGDCRYVAPEFLNSDIPKKDRDYKKMDIFSLGITLYELATNEDLPKNGVEWQQLRKGELHRLEEISDLSRCFKNLVTMMLKKDPSQRPTAQELLDTYLLSEEQVQVKWEVIATKLLETEKKDLEAQLKSLNSPNKRRKSVGMRPEKDDTFTSFLLCKKMRFEKSKPTS